MKNRVVITGMGTVNPLGSDVSEFWSNVKKGKCGIGQIQSFDTEDYKIKTAAEVKNFDPLKYLEKREVKRLDKYSQFALYAAHQAFENSGLNKDDIDSTRFGVIVSSGVGGLQTFEKQTKTMLEKGPNRVSPYFIPMMIANMAAGNIAITFGAKGICTCIVTACAASTNAIGEAYQKIKYGNADIMMTGGAEASICKMGMAGFTSLKALSTSQDSTRASIPFDKERNGFVMGEGAGILVLENLEHAKKRNAKIYGEIIGYGASCDAYHITAPAPEGEGGKRSMQLAIQDAGINPEDISYINAHGTSTPMNDKLETAGVKGTFGDYAYKVPISSTKSMIGHLLGASGAVEAITCTKALQEGFIPATIGYQTPDPECDLDYVPNEGRKTPIKIAMSNSFGFGGHNATLIFKKWIES